MTEVAELGNGQKRVFFSFIWFKYW